MIEGVLEELELEELETTAMPPEARHEEVEEVHETMEQEAPVDEGNEVETYEEVVL